MSQHKPSEVKEAMKILNSTENNKKGIGIRKAGIEVLNRATSNRSTLEIMMSENEAFRTLMRTNSSFKSAVNEILDMKEFLANASDKRKAIEELNLKAKREKQSVAAPAAAPQKRDYKADMAMMEAVIKKDDLNLINSIIRKDEKKMNQGTAKPKINNSINTLTSSGGYLVPEELHDQIINAMFDSGTIMSMAEIIDVKKKSITVPVAGTVSAAGWIDEEGAYTLSSPTVGHIKLTPHKVGAITVVSEELFEDSGFDVEKYITKDSGTQIGRIMEIEFINGTLSQRPTGILETAQFALTSSVTNSFNYSDILELFTSIKEAYRKNASWLISGDQNTLKTMVDLKDDDGNRVFIASQEPGILGYVLGSPVKISEAMPAITTTAKGVLFGDFSYYKIGLKRMISQQLLEKYSPYGQVGLITSLSADGELSVPEAVKYMACL